MAAKHETSILSCLYRLRDQPVFTKVLLKNWQEETRHAQVWAGLSPSLAGDFLRKMKASNSPRGRLDEEKRSALRELLMERLALAAFRDIELLPWDYFDEEETAESLKMPESVFIDLRLMRPSDLAAKKKLFAKEDAGALAGAPGYVVPVGSRYDLPKLDPDWLTWEPNPKRQECHSMLAYLLKIVGKKKDSRRPLRSVAAELNAMGFFTLKGRKFSEANVWRAVVPAELLHGNKKPWGVD